MPNQNELQHYGVPGMKWGRSKSSSASASGPAPRTKKNLRKDVKKRRRLSDSELTEKIGRLEKEKKLRELTDAEINGGKKVATDIMKSSGTKVATTMLAGATLYAVKAGLTGKVDLADMAGYIAPRPGKK